MRAKVSIFFCSRRHLGYLWTCVVCTQSICSMVIRSAYCIHGSVYFWTCNVYYNLQLAAIEQTWLCGRHVIGSTKQCRRKQQAADNIGLCLFIRVLCNKNNRWTLSPASKLRIRSANIKSTKRLKFTVRKQISAWLFLAYYSYLELSKQIKSKWKKNKTGRLRWDDLHRKFIESLSVWYKGIKIHLTDIIMLWFTVLIGGGWFMDGNWNIDHHTD